MYSVLILDDNVPMAQQILKTIPWEDMDCQVVGVCNDGISGREAIEQLKPDLIISDIEMPGLTGLQMIELTENFIADSKIIFISAYEKFSYAHQAIRLGACDYLLKPFTKSELMHAIEHALEELGGHKPETDGEKEEEAYSPMMRSVLKYLNAAACRPITLDMVAEYYKVSPSKLGRMIKKETNMRYVELVAKMCIQRAKELLALPYLNISDVAERVGYSDYLTFYKVFVRYENISPSDYRKSLRVVKDKTDED